MMEVYAGMVLEKVVLFKEALGDLFDDSESEPEAHAKRDPLAHEEWRRTSWHLSNCTEFLLSEKFDRMATYLEHPEVPRCGQSETLINVWRQMEAVRRGFKTSQGRLDHLKKLLQLTHYLGNTDLG